MRINFKGLAVAFLLLAGTGVVQAVDTFYGGGIAKGMPAVVALDANNLLMFVRGSDDALWWRRGNGNGGGWTEFTSLGGVLTSAPSCVDYKGMAKCFVRGADSALWTISLDKEGKSSKWMSLDGVITNQPGSAVAALDGETQSLYVFARGSDGAWWIREQGYDAETGLYPWKEWRKTLNTGFASPGCAAFGPTAVNCYVRFPDNTIHELAGANYQGGALAQIGGLSPSPPSAVSSGNHKVLRVFVRGTDDQLWMNTLKAGAWSEFQPMDVAIKSAPSCAWEVDGDIWCGALDTKGALTMIRLAKGEY